MTSAPPSGDAGAKTAAGSGLAAVRTTPRKSPRHPHETRRIGEVPATELARTYDLVVIGGGPAGVAGALKAAFLGRRALLVDKPKLPPDAASGLDVSFGGPTGLWSKALRDTAKTLDIHALRAMRLEDAVIWDQVRRMCLALATENASHQVQCLAGFKVDYLQATATVLAPGRVKVTLPDGAVEQEVSCEKLLLATGSSPQRMKGVPFDGVRVFDSDSVNLLGFLPRTAVIVGAGIIAIEYAKIFRKFGTQVTILVRSEAMGALRRIGLDRDISRKLLESLREDGVTILESTQVESFEVPSGPFSPTGPRTVLRLSSKDPQCPKSVECDMYLAAMGRTANVKGFGLEELGCEVHEKAGHLVVNQDFETSLPGIYGCGDVIGPPSLASTGVYQAQTSVERMFCEGAGAGAGGVPEFPVGMWTTPEASYFGLTKEAAEKQGLDVEEGTAPYTTCLRGRVFAPEGLLKLVFLKADGQIVGVHIIGQDACELIHYGMELVARKTNIFQVISTLFTAVTFHELFREAALDANSKLEFGLEWQRILQELCAQMEDVEAALENGELRRQFEAIDTDSSGALDAGELGKVFGNMGHPMKKGTVANMVRLADEDGSGTIDLPEFEKIFKVIAAMQKKEKEKENGKEKSGVEATGLPPPPAAA